MERAKLYQEAGADMLFVEAPRTMEQLEEIPRTLAVPTLYNMASSGKTPFLSVEEMQALGFRLVIYPNFMLMAAIPAMTRVLQALKRTGRSEHRRVWKGCVGTCQSWGSPSH